MKTSLILNVFWIAVLSAVLNFSAPVFGDESTDLLQKSFDLVHQALNPGGDPPSNDERTKLLTEAMKLAQQAPQHHVKGHRVQAILDIQAALTELKIGDPNNKASGYIHDAAEQLRDSISIAE